ncbi:DUF2345 domain-containing protein, partial [Hydromonas duriensis]
GKRLAASVAKGISFFTQGGGIKLFAAKGAVEVQAQSGNIELIAEKIIKIISEKKRIEIAAKDEILMTAGGSYIRINKAGIEEGTPGNWKAWAADHDTPGPKSVDYVLPSIGKEIFDEQIQILDVNGKLTFANCKYEIEMKNGNVFTGILTAESKTERIVTIRPEEISNIKIYPKNKES